VAFAQRGARVRRLGHRCAHGTAPSAACRTQAAQMQARPRAAAGTCARSAGANAACVHQHGACGWPLARSASIAHALAPPHNGQRVGSIGADAGLMGMLFCGTGRAAADRPRQSNVRRRSDMSHALTAAQRQELKNLLLARRDELQAQMTQNRANLAPVENTAGSVSQDESGRLANQTREVDAALTTLDADELARIKRALERMADDSYGLCDECGCAIPFERLKAEPMTRHCVACKSRFEQAQRARG